MKFLGKEVSISGTSSYVDESQVNRITIDVDYDFIDMKAGVKIPHEEVNAILERLGFEVSVIPANAGIQNAQNMDPVTSTG
jgi:phenylalanyl-tRNA synthetase beta subunit